VALQGGQELDIVTSLHADSNSIQRISDCVLWTRSGRVVVGR
jgi:hypothetical protein